MGGFLSGPSIVGSSVKIYPIHDLGVATTTTADNSRDNNGSLPGIFLESSQLQNEGGGNDDHGDNGGASFAHGSASLSNGSHNFAHKCISKNNAHEQSQKHPIHNIHDEKVNFCPCNPCISSAVQDLHRQVLSGVDYADVEMNRYLALCAFLESATATVTDTGGTSPPQRHCPSAASAHIVLDCFCGDASHSIALRKDSYQQQFRIGCKSSFVERADQAALAKMRDRAGLAGVIKLHTPLHIPLLSLLPRREEAFQHGLLPDLGHSLRSVLCKRYFSENAKKHWVKAATNIQVLNGGAGGLGFGAAAVPRGRSSAPAAESSQTTMHPLNSMQSQNAGQAAAQAAVGLWGQCNTICVNLLHDSIPCLKKFKRTGPVHDNRRGAGKAQEKAHTVEQSDGSQENSRSKRMEQVSAGCSTAAGAAANRSAGGGGGGMCADRVDVCACINVLYGTLLKLYNLGAKVPTFNARVSMTRRLSEVSCLSVDEQKCFLARFPSLVRLCFMEYSLNALRDWLPCERELLLRVCPPMGTYCNIAVSMCDIFRQEAVVTGRESWEDLDRAALVSIERCIRVCKFKMIKPVEAVIKCVHLAPAQFDCRALHLPHLPCLVHRTVECVGNSNGGSSKTVMHAHHMDAQPTPFDDSEQQLVDELCQSLEQKHPASVTTCPHSSSVMQSCRTLHSNFSVHRLPEIVTWRQHESLDWIHSACASSHAAAHCMSFCIVCALNGKGFQNKIRMCSISRELSCVSCPPGTLTICQIICKHRNTDLACLLQGQ